MKLRSRKYKITSEPQSYWPSFVDIMTTVSLVFFFIMIISSGISRLFVDNIAEKRENLYEAIQEKLDGNNVDENIIKFDKDKGNIDIKTETFFESAQWDLKSDGVELAGVLGGIFYDLLSDHKIESEIKYIEVIGHTDYAGTTIDNRRLSTERAMSFLNQMVPMNSDLENSFGHKFKASGMSEFETNPTKEERDRAGYDAEAAKDQRKIEVRMVFTNSDIEEAIKERVNEKINRR